MLSKHLISRLRRVDWDFAGTYSGSPFSTLHWHPSQIPATLIGLLSREREVVLDPFCGSGTALVEAQRLARRAVGIDLHPVSCLVSRAKTLPCSARHVAALAADLERDARALLSTQPMLGPAQDGRPLIPDAVQGAKWYTRTTLGHLAVLWRDVAARSGHLNTIARTAFSSILLPVCRETRHWGYVCDNAKPVGDSQRDVLSEYVKALGRFAAAYLQRDREVVARVGSRVRVPRVRVVCSDVRAALTTLGRAKVDLVITSPPYFGVADYIKAQRLTMEWFDWNIEPLRAQEIGARSKRHRAKATAEYLDELGQTFWLLRRCLRPGGVAVLVVGESRSREPVVDRIRGLLEDVGFGLEMDVNRIVSSQRRQAPSVGGERILVCVAP